MEKAHHAWPICLKAPIIFLFKGMISLFHCSKVWFQSGLVDCQSGVWMRQEGFGGSSTWSNKGCHSPNPLTSALTCPAGYRAYNSQFSMCAQVSHTYIGIASLWD